MLVQEQILEKLQAVFSPRQLQVINESHHHAGHADRGATIESHFKVIIVADAFDGMSRLARHRAIHQALGKELTGRIHALSLIVNG